MMIEELVFSGTPYQIGLQHGKLLAKEITQVIKIYSQKWALSIERIPEAVFPFKRTITEKYPHLAEEISGIAKGSGLTADLLYAINARTELLVDSAAECTSIAVPGSAHREGHTLLAQNWDWYAPFNNLTTVVEVRPDHQLRMKMLIEPGMVGKMGLNEQGLGICMNILTTKRLKTEGVPVHVIMRKVLECENYAAAENYLLLVPKAASTNYVVGDTTGRAGSFETTPDSVEIIGPARLVTHTNSFTAAGEFCLRKKIFDLAVSRYLKRSIDDTVSTEEVNKALSLVRFPKVSRLERFFTTRSETIHTLNLNLTEKTLAISSRPDLNRFQVYRF